MANVLATEVKRQAGRLSEQNEKFHDGSLKVYEKLTAIAQDVKSEDSDLAKTLELYADAYNQVKDKVVEKYANLAKIMTDWADKTVDNENKATSDVVSTQKDLENISKMYDVIFK